jgi:uncharacterized circularly permuted ATP-grasp superfamily protein/uncharacterized alpha-E superfamily protein
MLPCAAMSGGESEPRGAPASPAGLVEDFARAYAPRPGAFDELHGRRGDESAGAPLLPHWRAFLEHLIALGAPALAGRWAKAQELIHENGVSYNLHGDPQGLDRPWPLSPVPLVLATEEWQPLAAGLAQRARLLERVLDDLYGPQRLIREGVVPPAALWANPAYLRACQGATAAEGRWLPFYAVDLVRTPDGRFAVLSDRTQIPTGAGYALENRIIVSRALPEAYRACQVERLAPFFRMVREMLLRLAPRNKDNPRIVVLSHGPSDPTYFEQAYLAQYLGYPVVHGGDLTVRSGRVYLKTLGGLHPVDVILRRVEDDACDPLELRQDALTGVPGLLQAVRERAVAIANPLGSGLAATPALAPYLGAACRFLLGEDLIIDTVQTHWCGDASARQQALSRLSSLVVKPAFALANTQPIFGARLDRAALQSLRARIEDSPEAYVAQEMLPLPTTPTLLDGKLEARPWVLRTYLVARPDGHAVMPGGLTRFAPDDASLEVSIQRGGRSKDTWILARGPVAEFSMLPPKSAAIAPTRSGGDLPSRVADNLLWLGRYAERAEALTRLGRVIGARLADQAPEAGPAHELGPLIDALRASAHLTEEAPRGSEGADEARTDARQTDAWKVAALAALDDPGSTGSLRATLRSLQRVARECRDRLSGDSWRVLMGLDVDLGADAGARQRGADRLDALLPRLDEVIITLSALSGIVADSMTRGLAWRFVDVGRRLERASQTVTWLRATFGRRCEREGPLFEALLAAADSGMTYRRRYLNRLEAAPVLDLLLTDETNPRAVMFQVAVLNEHLAALPRDAEAALRAPEQRIALALARDLELADVEALTALDAGNERPRLTALLGACAKALPALSDALSASYLSHAAVSRQLGGRFEGAQ